MAHHDRHRPAVLRASGGNCHAERGRHVPAQFRQGLVEPVAGALRVVELAVPLDVLGLEAARFHERRAQRDEAVPLLRHHVEGHEIALVLYPRRAVAVREAVAAARSVGGLDAVAVVQRIDGAVPPFEHEAAGRIGEVLARIAEIAPVHVILLDVPREPLGALERAARGVVGRIARDDVVHDDVERLRSSERKIARRAGAPFRGGHDFEIERHRSPSISRRGSSLTLDCGWANRLRQWACVCGASHRKRLIWLRCQSAGRRGGLDAVACAAMPSGASALLGAGRRGQGSARRPGAANRLFHSRGAAIARRTLVAEICSVASSSTRRSTA